MGVACVADVGVACVADVGVGGWERALRWAAGVMPRVKRTHVLALGVCVFLSWNVLTFYSLTNRDADMVTTAPTPPS